MEPFLGWEGGENFHWKEQDVPRPWRGKEGILQG